MPSAKLFLVTERNVVDREGLDKRMFIIGFWQAKTQHFRRRQLGEHVWTCCQKMTRHLGLFETVGKRLLLIGRKARCVWRMASGGREKSECELGDSIECCFLACFSCQMFLDLYIYVYIERTSQGIGLYQTYTCVIHYRICLLLSVSPSSIHRSVVFSILWNILNFCTSTVVLPSSHSFFVWKSTLCNTGHMFQKIFSISSTFILFFSLLAECPNLTATKLLMWLQALI